MRKKMIEVAIPLDAINRESAREKEPFTRNHPRSLHIWWARRPLVACRAVLFASLVDDPESDPANCTQNGRIDINKVAERRKELFQLIEDLANWDNSTDETVLNKARCEIAASYASAKVHDSKDWSLKDRICDESVQAFVSRTASPANVKKLLAEVLPPVLDPFSGGGSIPLEAQRLGLKAYASDLNPVATLISKALIELPAHYSDRPAVNPDAAQTQAGAAKKVKQKSLSTFRWSGAQGLSADVRYYGEWMAREAKNRIGHLYPVGQITPSAIRTQPNLKSYEGVQLPAIAWLWARTVKCPNPACSARTPLIRSFFLSKKKGKEVYAAPVLDADAKTASFLIKRGIDAPKHNSDRTGAYCLFCGRFIKKPELREIARNHGVNPVPIAQVCEGKKEKVYLPFDGTVPPLPSTDVSFLDHPMTDDKRWFSPPLYGLPNFSDIFTARQLTALTTLCDLVGTAREQIRNAATHSQHDDPSGYAEAVTTYLGLAISRWADLSNSLCSWNTSNQNVRALFARQAVPMSWDFVELSPFGAVAPFTSTVEAAAKSIEAVGVDVRGIVLQQDATMLQPAPSSLISTDPPYYDNIGYADLSDFFYVWLRRCLSTQYPDLFSTVLTPKASELIATANRHAGSKEAATLFFENGLSAAFGRIRSREHPDFPTTIYYAFKQAETDDEDPDDTDDGDGSQSVSIASTGWETMLEGLIGAGFAITGTWPMRTERGTRSVGLGTNALASSIVLVCRPRTKEAPRISRRDFVNALKHELPAALKDLQSGNIAPVDLAQAAIGPGMAVYSRYSKVLESSGERLTVRTALALINQVLDEVLAEQEGDYDADTRWSLKWFEQFAHDDGPFGDANTLATAMSIGINGLVETGIVQAKAGKVRLLKRIELMGGSPETWDPATDTDIVHWEVCQYLIHALDTKGEAGAAALLRRINARYPGASETARELAYRLYTICERKKWAQEAMAYNSLIVAWPEIVKLAQSSDGSGGEAQTTMF